MSVSGAFTIIGNIKSIDLKHYLASYSAAQSQTRINKFSNQVHGIAQQYYMYIFIM